MTAVISRLIDVGPMLRWIHSGPTDVELDSILNCFHWARHIQNFLVLHLTHDEILSVNWARFGARSVELDSFGIYVGFDSFWNYSGWAWPIFDPLMLDLLLAGSKLYLCGPCDIPFLAWRLGEACWATWRATVRHSRQRCKTGARLVFSGRAWLSFAVMCLLLIL